MKPATLQEQLAEAQATVRALQEELAETNRGLVALTMELERARRARTAELARSNEALRVEIAERQRMEEALRTAPQTGNGRSTPSRIAWPSSTTNTASFAPTGRWPSAWA